MTLLGLTMLAPTTVTLVARAVTGRDRYGNDVYTDTRTDSPGWVVWPSGLGAEVTQGQDIATDNLTCIAPVGTVLASVDRVEVAGKSYEVQGNPWSWQSPFTGTQPGVQVELKAVSG